MSHSVEHTAHFHMARRIAREIAPGFRVLSTPQLSEGQVVLDLRHRTIEIPEGISPLEAVGAILFQVGHVRLRGRPDLQEHFGNADIKDEEVLVGLLSRQGAKADLLAANWAQGVFSSNWNIDSKAAAAIIAKYVWLEDEWREYYAAK